MKSKKGFTLIELAIVLAIFGITLIALTPFINRMKERASEVKCWRNLSLISAALHMYAADHAERFPPGLDELYPGYVREKKIFQCPAAGEKPGGAGMGYEYVPGLTEASAPSEIILYDKRDNHGARGRNIVRVSGQIEWVEDTDKG